MQVSDKNSLVLREFQHLHSTQSDIYREDLAFIVRNDCSKNSGVYNFDFKRCYFIVEHPTPGLNFSEQVLVCNKQGAILSYPRTLDEIAYLWDFFERTRSELSVEATYNTSLHVGFKRQAPVTSQFPQFNSIDGHLKVNSKRNMALFQDMLASRSVSLLQFNILWLSWVSCEGLFQVVMFSLDVFLNMGIIFHWSKSTMRKEQRVGQQKIQSRTSQHRKFPLIFKVAWSKCSFTLCQTFFKRNWASVTEFENKKRTQFG